MNETTDTTSVKTSGIGFVFATFLRTAMENALVVPPCPHMYVSDLQPDHRVTAGLGFIAAVLAVGGLIIISVVLGSLFQRERGKELVAEIRRLVKRD